ncbi:PAP2 superfamily protein [Mucilaginibacter yixingensis]|uniref:PAP2 superfamily protein n=1 Tax=Mucilaginibacter yixingensis TaxID=1295612 RepID=A0A2T5JAT2_9SPHI|nr:phosphatase PAP2 family protein [Mucilaginibacter yixingensis]PTQ97983.1 PAP2 superfamily protein [Mucilaginibacter yixingensis]
MKKGFTLLLLRLFFAASSFAANIAPADTVATPPADSAQHQTVASYILPTALISYGVLSFHSQSLRNADFYVQRNFSNSKNRLLYHVDDILQYSPAAAVYALNTFGIQGKHNFADRTFTYVIAEGLMISTTKLMKRGMSRPDINGNTLHGFPSGHSATAFLAAEFLSQEYGDRSVWFTVGGYSAAALIAVLRVRNNFHYMSDVITGAGIGIASAKLAYLVYPVLKQALLPKNRNNIVIMPARLSNINGVYIAGTF